MYSIDYFIQKFEAIPEDKLIANNVYDYENEAGCALGWCSKNPPGINCYGTEEFKALVNLFEPIKSVTMPSGSMNGWNVADVNNGDNPSYQQPTPKQRILAALNDIKVQNKEQNAQECDATEVQ